MAGVCGVSVGTGAVRIAYISDGRRVEDSIDAAGAQDLLLARLVDHGPFEDIVLAGWDTDAVTALLETLGDGAMPEDGAAPKVRVVEESRALLAYARTVPELAAKNYVLVLDLGKKGLSATALDTAGDHVEWTARTADISGDRFDDVVRDIVMAKGILPEPVGQDATEEYRAFFRELKELVSSSAGVRAPNRGPMLLTRKEFEQQIAPMVSDALSWASERAPDAVLLIGGGAGIPAVRTVIEGRWTVPVHVPDAPAMAIAKGAALDEMPAAPASSDVGIVTTPDGDTRADDVTAPAEIAVPDDITALDESTAPDDITAADDITAPVDITAPDDITAPIDATGAGVAPDAGHAQLSDATTAVPHGDVDPSTVTGLVVDQLATEHLAVSAVPEVDPGVIDSPDDVETVPSEVVAEPARRGSSAWSVRDASVMVAVVLIVVSVVGLVLTRGNTPAPTPLGDEQIPVDSTFAAAVSAVVGAPEEAGPAPNEFPTSGPARLSDEDLYERVFEYDGQMYQPVPTPDQPE